MIANTEQTETAPSSVAAEPKATKKAPAGKRRAPVAPKKAKSGKKASPAKKAPKAPKEGKQGGPVRDGSKAAKILELLKRPGGVTSKELMKPLAGSRIPCVASLSGTVGKKMGLTVISAKGEEGERSYSINA